MMEKYKREIKGQIDGDGVILIERSKGPGDRRYWETRIYLTREEIEKLAKAYPVGSKP